MSRDRPGDVPSVLMNPGGPVDLRIRAPDGAVIRPCGNEPTASAICGLPRWTSIPGRYQLLVEDAQFGWTVASSFDLDGREVGVRVTVFSRSVDVRVDRPLPDGLSVIHRGARAFLRNDGTHAVSVRAVHGRWVDATTETLDRGGTWAPDLRMDGPGPRSTVTLAPGQELPIRGERRRRVEGVTRRTCARLCDDPRVVDRAVTVTECALAIVE